MRLIKGKYFTKVKDFNSLYNEHHKQCLINREYSPSGKIEVMGIYRMKKDVTEGDSVYEYPMLNIFIISEIMHARWDFNDPVALVYRIVKRNKKHKT